MNDYLTIDEVSRLLRVKSRTVQNYIRKGLIPAIKLNNKTLRIPKQELIDKLEKLSE